MAARKVRTKHNEKTREKIKTTQLINRLEAYANGSLDPQTKKPVYLEAGQVRAIEILLNKTLPNLTQADITHNEPEKRTYEEIRTELVREHGEPLALLLLKEITQADYLKMMQETA